MKHQNIISVREKINIKTPSALEMDFAVAVLILLVQ
jgi:hypothetical protein